LLRVLDDLPLAVTLMAHRAESEPDLAGVLQRWQRERTEILKRGPSDHRLTNLAVSIDLSLMGPRMTDSARRLFALLGLLPDGWRAAELDRLLPNDGAAAAAKLRQVGLAVDRGDRIHLLAPVREHSQRNRRPTDADLGRLIDEVSRRAKAGDRVGAEGGAEAAVDIVANAGNIEAVLLLALERNRFDTLPAVLGFAEAQRFTGVGSTMLLERACKATKARDDVLGEANCIKSLGDIALARSDHDGARKRFEEALPLYRRIGSVRGEANCIQSLGDIALKRSDHDEARNRFEKALHLYERISDPYSIGVAHALLAQVTEGAERRSHLAAARAAWESIGRHDLIATLPME
jgi:tetratricopeptide (TPR) repeat protein